MSSYNKESKGRIVSTRFADGNVLKETYLFYTNVQEGLEIHGHNVDTGNFDGYRGSFHDHEKISPSIDVELCPVGSKDYVRKFETLKGERNRDLNRDF